MNLPHEVMTELTRKAVTAFGFGGEGEPATNKATQYVVAYLQYCRQDPFLTADPDAPAIERVIILMGSFLDFVTEGIEKGLQEDDSIFDIFTCAMIMTRYGRNPDLDQPIVKNLVDTIFKWSMNNVLGIRPTSSFATRKPRKRIYELLKMWDELPTVNPIRR